MPLYVLTSAGFVAMVVLLAVPLLVLRSYTRARDPSTMSTAVALLVWTSISLVLAAVWFLVAVAAHRTDRLLTVFWVTANAVYPLLGAGVVWVHRRLQR